MFSHTIAAFFVGPFIQKFGFRRIVQGGTTLVVIGFGCSSVAPSVAILMLTHGCLVGQFTWWRHHDDVIKWKHFPRHWAFVQGIHRSPVNSPRKGQWRGALLFFFDLRLNKRLSKQLWGWWFDTPSRPLWRQYNETGFNKHSGESCSLVGDLTTEFIMTILNRKLSRILLSKTSVKMLRQFLKSGLAFGLPGIENQFVPRQNSLLRSAFEPIELPILA